MKSKYSDILPLIVRDIHILLTTELNLPTTFKSIDPEIGEAYGMLQPQNLMDNRGHFIKIDSIFYCTAAFRQYWEASSWAMTTSMNLDDLVPKVKQKVDRRGILEDFERTEPIKTEGPRAPLRAIAVQKPGSNTGVWVTGLTMPCTIKLLVIRDIICGHL